MTEAIRAAIEGASAYLTDHPEEARYTDSMATARIESGLRVRVARSLAGSSARDLLRTLDGQAVRLPADEQFYPSREHLRWHHAQVFQGQI